MRIQIVFLSLLFLSPAWSYKDSVVDDLFRKYDLLFYDKKVELIDEIFTKKFIQSSGGKSELVQKIKELSADETRSESSVQWKESKTKNKYLARMKTTSFFKGQVKSRETEFVIIKENGILKIDGTISDGH